MYYLLIVKRHLAVILFWKKGKTALGMVMMSAKANQVSVICGHTGCKAQAQQLMAISTGLAYVGSYIKLSTLSSSQAFSTLECLVPPSTFV